MDAVQNSKLAQALGLYIFDSWNNPRPGAILAKLLLQVEKPLQKSYLASQSPWEDFAASHQGNCLNMVRAVELACRTTENEIQKIFGIRLSLSVKVSADQIWIESSLELTPDSKANIERTLDFQRQCAQAKTRSIDSILGML